MPYNNIGHIAYISDVVYMIFAELHMIFAELLILVPVVICQS